MARGSQLAVHPDYLKDMSVDAVHAVLSDALLTKTQGKVVPLYPKDFDRKEASISNPKWYFSSFYLLIGATAFVLLVYFVSQIYLFRTIERIKSEFKVSSREREEKILALEANVSGLTDVAKFVVKRIGEVEEPKILSAAMPIVDSQPLHRDEPLEEESRFTVSVIAPKANLRSGPGENFSTSMTVARGSSFIVEERRGDWLQIISPNGSRAWLLSTLVSVKGEKKS